MKLGDLVKIPFNGVYLANKRNDLLKDEFANGVRFTAKILRPGYGDEVLLEFDAAIPSTWKPNPDQVLDHGCRVDRWYYWSDLSNLVAADVVVPQTVRSSASTVPLNCCECKEAYPYAESNMSGGRLLCYSCRSTLRWKYPECKA